MVNYRVEDLVSLLQALQGEGCQVLEETDDSAYGKFGWVIDLEGNKVELWHRQRGNETRPRSLRQSAAQPAAVADRFASKIGAI